MTKQKTIEDQIKLFREIFRVWCYDADGFNHINDFKMWIREQLILAERRGYKKAKKEIIEKSVQNFIDRLESDCEFHTKRFHKNSGIMCNHCLESRMKGGS